MKQFYSIKKRWGKGICMLTLALLCTITAFSHESKDATPYNSIFVKGRIWKCLYRAYGQSLIRHYSIYEVLDDTIVNGEKWWRIAYRYELSELGKGSTFYVVERDGVAYRAGNPSDAYRADYPTEENLYVRLDYSVGDRDEFFCRAPEIDSVFVGGKLRKRMVFSHEAEERGFRIIEGIGCNTDGGFIGVRPISFYTELLEVYDNGELIATKEDFYKEGTTGISTVKISGKPEPLLYDLTGRRLSDRPAKGIYIENGRKVCR